MFGYVGYVERELCNAYAHCLVRTEAEKSLKVISNLHPLDVVFVERNEVIRGRMFHLFCGHQNLIMNIEKKLTLCDRHCV